MKMTKRIFAFVMAIAMVMSMTVISFAEGEGHKLTINSKTAGHTYYAYQVFAGTYIPADPTDTTETHPYGTLGDIVWGSGVNGDALLAALQASSNTEFFNEHNVNVFEGLTTAAQVANVIEPKADDSAFLFAFANVVAEHLTNERTASGAETANADNTYTYEITGLADGYYFVMDEIDADNMTDNAYSKYMLRVVGDETINAKADVPDIDKDIVVGQNEENEDITAKENNAAIGDTVNYKVTSKVPNMAYYDSYTYIVHDTMSKGLDFNNDVAITLDGTDLTEGTDYTVTSNPVLDGDSNPTGETAITITFINFIQYKDKTDADIVITYSATINEAAVIGNIGGNPNTVKLEYSNNPNGDGTGETTDHTVYTYVTGIQINKIDGQTKAALAGAEFTITGTALNKIVVVDTVGTHVEEITEDFEGTFTVDANGVLIIDGLKAGEYTITEIKAPAGYNLLTEPLTLTVEWEAGETLGTCVWKFKLDGAEDFTEVVNSDNRYQFDVENNKGNQLPETGGIGTTIFYVVGSALLLVAAVALIAKKRMGNEM